MEQLLLLPLSLLLLWRVNDLFNSIVVRIAFGSVLMFVGVTHRFYIESRAIFSFPVHEYDDFVDAPCAFCVARKFLASHNHIRPWMKRAEDARDRNTWCRAYFSCLSFGRSIEESMTTIYVYVIFIFRQSSPVGSRRCWIYLNADMMCDSREYSWCFSTFAPSRKILTFFHDPPRGVRLSSVTGIFAPYYSMTPTELHFIDGNRISFSGYCSSPFRWVKFNQRHVQIQPNNSNFDEPSD